MLLNLHHRTGHTMYVCICPDKASSIRAVIHVFPDGATHFRLVEAFFYCTYIHIIEEEAAFVHVILAKSRSCCLNSILLVKCVE